jgi:uncharacterized damage-inducible protein DinB
MRPRETTMSDFDSALCALVRLDEAELARPWPWRGRTMNVREVVYRILEDAQGAYVRVAAAPSPEARRILALAQRALGDLRALLIDLPAAVIDGTPGEGEWSIRDTLRHMLTVERRYARQTLHAVERADADPVRIPEDQLPTPAQMDVSGEVGAVLARLADARLETNHRLGEVPPEAMTRPTIWVQLDVDVRFRLHRFAAHVIEHTIQCEKTLLARGVRVTEGRRLARRISALFAEVEALGGHEAAQAVEAQAIQALAAIGATEAREHR